METGIFQDIKREKVHSFDVVELGALGTGRMEQGEQEERPW